VCSPLIRDIKSSITDKMSDPATPKLDFKMLIVPALLFFGKQIDFKDPSIVELVTNSFIGGNSKLIRYLCHCIILSMCKHSSI